MTIRRLTRRLVWVVAIVTACATSVAADQPVKTEYPPFSGTALLTEVCSFEITVDYTASVTEMVYFHPSGAVKRINAHWLEQDTYSANGKSLTSFPYRFNANFLFDSDGNITHLYVEGSFGRIPLPGGQFYVMAGRYDFAAHGFPDFAPGPDVGATVNRDLFCAALAP